MTEPTDADVARLIARIRLDEGSRRKPYKDTVGKLTIGVGRNLDDVGLSDDEIDYLLMNDLKKVERGLDNSLLWWRSLSTVRQSVIINMAFNLGLTKLLGFKNTLEAMRTGDWKKAKAGMLASLWARQVGARAQRLAAMMETDHYVD